VGWYASLPENVVAFVRPEYEIMDIQAHLRAFLADPGRFLEMGENGRRLLEKHHTPETYAEAAISLATAAQRFRPYAAAAGLTERAAAELGTWMGLPGPRLAPQLWGPPSDLPASKPGRWQQAVALQRIRQAVAEHLERLRRQRAVALQGVRQALAEQIAQLQLDVVARDGRAEATGVARPLWSSQGDQEALNGAEDWRIPIPVLPSVEELPKGWLAPEEDALIPPRHLWLGSRDSISHYYRWVWEYLAYLTLLCDLHRESAVLELGCGHGRTAHGLLAYLRSPGQYYGLDVDSARIKDAQDRIQKRFPSFQFIWADAYNAHYNPSGTTPAAGYVFPFAAAAFDVIYAASLFSHLLPDETQRYFQESCRVLKPGGKCLFSMFVLDYYRGQGTTISPLYEFNYALPEHPGVAVRDIAHPDALIGYSLEKITLLANSAGLRLLRVVPGLWSESPGLAANEQDLILLCREA
jgi:SAM-dependent methyltransferase